MMLLQDIPFICAQPFAKRKLSPVVRNVLGPRQGNRIYKPTPHDANEALQCAPSQ